MTIDRAQEIVNGVAKNHPKLNIDSWTSSGDVVTVRFEVLPVSDPRTVCKWFTDAGAKSASIGHIEAGDFWIVHFHLKDNKMSDLTDFSDRFVNETSDETNAIFNQGLLILEAIDAGYKPADVKREYGIRSGKGKQAIANRELVAQVFGENYAHDMDWSLHLLCCKLGGAKVNKRETFSHAEELLKEAITGYPDPETGVMRPHSTKTLKEKYASHPESKVTKETVYKGETLITHLDSLYTPIGRGTEINLWFAEKYLYDKFKEGETVTITITRNLPPQPAESDSEKAEVAA